MKTPNKIELGLAAQTELLDSVMQHINTFVENDNGSGLTSRTQNYFIERPDGVYTLTVCVNKRTPKSGIAKYATQQANKGMSPEQIVAELERETAALKAKLGLA